MIHLQQKTQRIQIFEFRRPSRRDLTRMTSAVFADDPAVEQAYKYLQEGNKINADQVQELEARLEDATSDCSSGCIEEGRGRGTETRILEVLKPWADAKKLRKRTRTPQLLAGITSSITNSLSQLIQWASKYDIQNCCF